MCLPEKTPQNLQSATAAAVQDDKNASLPEIPVENISKMNAELKGDVILTFEDIVYKVPRSWIERHPGGAQAIYSVAGQDASALIRAMHNPATVAKIKKMLKKVGQLPKDAKETLAKKSERSKRDLEMAEDFAKIHDLCEKNGWYEEDLSVYTLDLIRVFVFFVLAIVCLVYSHELAAEYSWISQKGAIIVGSIFLGLYFQNVAFFGHDTGHNAMCGHIDKDFWTGIFFGPLASGIGISWWKSTHNCHHIAPNSLEDDPNVQHVPLFCFDEKMADNWWSNYHGRPIVMNEIGKLLVRYQHWYHYPIMGVARFLLYIHTIKHMIELCPLRKTAEINKTLRVGKNQEDLASWKPVISMKAWLIEAAALMTFYIWFGSLLYATGYDAPLFMVVSSLVAGVLHVQINLSHIIMDYCVENPVAELCSGDYSFYEWQALSTLDIDCADWMHWFHGGLEYQLEHHVFPRVHRKNLPKLIPHVDAIFGKYGIPVVRIGFLEANWILCKHLARVGAYVADKWDPSIPNRKRGDTTREIIVSKGSRGMRWT